MLQGEPDERYMLREDLNVGIRVLKDFGLTYDILIFERQLPQTIDFVDRHPDQVFVLDHIAKPRIKEGVLEPWRTNIRELAKRENVYCKVSDMVTEANYTSWKEEQLHPYFDTVLEAFTSTNLMFGSDWPVCLVACNYARWHKIVSNWATDLSSSERRRLFGDTAAEAYRL